MHVLVDVFCRPRVLHANGVQAMVQAKKQIDEKSIASRMSFEDSSNVLSPQLGFLLDSSRIFMSWLSIYFEERDRHNFIFTLSKVMHVFTSKIK